MLPPLRARRAAGLLAAGSIGLSTAVLGFPGVAHADPSGWTFTAADSPVVVPAGTCAIDWTVMGSRGGADVDGLPALAPTAMPIRTAVGVGDTFTLSVGAPGADALDGGAGGANPQGSGAWDGGDAYNADSGGGGAASVVLRNGSPYLVGQGGEGRGPAHGGGAPGLAPTTPPLGDIVPPTSSTPVAPVAMADGVSQGYITGTGVACGSFPHNPLVPSPGAPYSTPGPQQLMVRFDPGVPNAKLPPGTTWEYSFDGTTWKPSGSNLVYDPHGAYQQFSVTGLTDGQAYVVRLRATNPDGISDTVQAFGPATPYTRPGEPTSVAVEERPSALAVSWAPPAVAGTYPLTGYSVFVMRADSTEDDQGPSWSCETDAAARGCVIGVPAGDEYVAYVSAVAGTLGGHENMGDPEVVTSGAVPLPAMPRNVPEKDGDLLGSAGPITTVPAGSSVVLKGSGFAAFSKVRAIAYSTPTDLGVFVTDENGEFEVTVTIPEDLEAGEHSLVVTGVDASGNPHTLRVDVTVTADGTTTVTRTTPAALAYTGASLAGPAIGGVAAVVLGAGLLTVSRRRPARGTDA